MNRLYIALDIPRYYNREYEIGKNESKTALPGKKLGMKVKVSYSAGYSTLL